MTEDIESLEDLQATIERIDGNVQAAMANIRELKDENRGLRQRVEELEATVDAQATTIQALRTVMPKGYKRIHRIEKILEHAKDRAGKLGVSISTHEASAAAGVSGQAARNYLTQLDQTFEWARYKPGKGQNTSALIVDLNDQSLDDCIEQVREQADQLTGATS